MQKNILVTGATDGIGLETAKMLVAKGHHVLVHGRSSSKLEIADKTLAALSSGGSTKTYIADLTKFKDVASLAEEVRKQHAHLDAVINNAGVFKTPHSITEGGLDTRFVVNTFSPYLLTQKLLPLLEPEGRVINVSSAAQASVNLDALAGQNRLDDMEAYAQSKLAIIMWSRAMAEKYSGGPAIIAVNPGSLLASKMVREGFGVAGNDLSIGAEILTRAALSEEFADASGQYFDNDTGQFATPHADALDASQNERVVQAIEQILAQSNI